MYSVATAVQYEQLDRATIDEVTSDWSEKPTTLATKMVDQHGLPDEITNRRQFWHDVGVWKRVQVSRDGTPHNFPKEHEDHLGRTITYPIDPEVADDLLAFDGSNVLWRTRGELFVADAGQNRFEEVDTVEKSGNYGWNVKEGTHCFSTEHPNEPPEQCPSTTPDAVRGGSRSRIPSSSTATVRARPP